MSDATLIALITTVPPTLAALSAVFLGVLNYLQGSKIHVLVNSNMTAVKTDLAVANQRIEEMQELVAALTKAKPPQ